MILEWWNNGNGYHFLLITIAIIICYGIYARLINWWNIKNSKNLKQCLGKRKTTLNIIQLFTI